MANQPVSYARPRLTVLLGAVLFTATLPFAHGDADPHAAQDAFDAEVASLLPQMNPAFEALATPPLQRSTLGEWGSVIPWTPHIPVSAANLPDGRILTFASNQRTRFPSGPEFTYAATWNPATGQFVEHNHPSHDMFCGALVMLPDGRVLVNGGRNTTVRSSIFDWRVNNWTRTPDMNDPRWYNTSVALPNGRVWTVSGSGGSGTAERWDESSGWSRLTGINWNLVTSEPGYITIWHPLVSLAPDGRLIHFGPTDTMHWVTTDGSGTMSNTGTVVPDTHYPKEGCWVMYDEGRILVAGGGANTVNNPSDTTTGTSTARAYTVDVRSGAPIVSTRNPMAFPRQFANCVVLPNGEVMVMGGNTSGLKFNDTGSILTPEIWNPTTGQWRAMAAASVPRNYHSLALLLADGRVMSGGGGLGGGDHQDAELFTPPTLFNADGTLAPRPLLNTAPSAIGIATRFTVTGTPGIQKFSFIKMSAITHSVNTDLRYLSMPFTEVSPGTYDITAHSSLNVMTPGYWMLFGLNSAGTHSVAKTILVDAINAVRLNFPGNQASYVNEPASLQLVATSPAGSVLTWSATGLPDNLAINPASGLISGTPAALGTFNVRATVAHGTTSDFKDFAWTVQPTTLNQNFPSFPNAGGLTLNGNAEVTGGALRLAPNAGTQAGSAFLSNPLTIGSNTSFSTRWVFRIHGSADGADGMTFMVHGAGVNALGAAGNGLGYDGIGQSLAIEIDNFTGVGDANANHIAILSDGSVANHLATFTPGWDLENGQSHTVWVEYDGPANALRVYAAQGIVSARPAAPVMSLAVDLPALVGSQAWFGFSAGTGGSFNNYDVENWNISVNAFALPAPPSLTNPGNQTTVLAAAVDQQMQATDPNGDLLSWTATGLPTGLSINAASGLITGTPITAGTFSTTVTVTDGNTIPVSASFTWTIDGVLTVQPLLGTAVVAGTTVSLTAQANGGLNPQFRWNFGDGTPETSFSSSASTSHGFSTPGRYLVTVTVRDDTAREVTASYRQAVYAPLTGNKPTASSSILLEPRQTANARLWVVNPDNDSVTVFDAVTRVKLAEVNVGLAPRTLALAADGRVWVSNADAATITILNPDYSIAQTISLPHGSRPYGVVFDPAGANAFVALENGGKILKLNPTSGATEGSLDVGLHARHLSVTADGVRLLATRFVTPRLPGEETASVQTTVGSVDYGGEVLAINSSTFTIEATIILEHSEEPDTSNSSKGIPNYLGAAAISPDGLSAWVPSKQDNIKRGSLRHINALTHDMAVRSIASRIELVSGSEDTAGRIDYDDAGIASASAFDPNGNFLFTALEGSREIAVSDPWAKVEILRFDAGRAPQGLVVSPDGRTLFVHNFMDRTVTIHDLNALVNGATVAPAAPAVLNCVTTEKLSSTVLVGKQLFYDTRDVRLAFQQYVSCAGCHNDGGHDGRVWDFTQFGEGLRNTITLRGHGGTAQGPLHWTGNFDEVQDFEGQIRNFALGTGLMSDADFHGGTRSQPLGDPKAGRSADLDALAAYVGSLTKHGDSPERNADGTLTTAAVAGQIVFQQQNCAQCHSGTRFTDSALGVFRDVGTLKPSSGGRLGGALTGLDTPTLLGLFTTAPYLHDGSAATVEAAVAAHSGVSLTATAMSDLAAYLRQLDDMSSVGTIPPPLGLVAAYNFDAGAGTTLPDMSGNGNTGTISGAAWTAAGKNGSALSFDGTNDMVTIADSASLDLTNGMTLSAWIYPTVNTGVRDVVIKEGSNVDIYNLYHRNWRGLPEANVYVAGGNRVAEGTSLPINAWTHLASTYDGSVLRLFINGSQAASLTLAGSITTSTGALRIGGNVLWAEYFQGRIDDLRVYNRALTAAQVQTDMNTAVTNPVPNTAPTISDIADRLTTEDGTPGNVGFLVSDAETAAGSLTVSGTSSNTTLVPNASIAFGGSGANRTVTITPAANQNGSATITISVSDGQATVSDTFLLTVTAVNDAPSMTPIANQAISVDGATSALVLTIGDPETPAASLTVSGSSSNQVLVPNDNIVIGGSGANRTVTVTPAAGQIGSATIAVAVSDGLLTTGGSFLLTVSGSVTGTLTFSSAAALTIPASGAATPYPSSIVVTGMSGSISVVTVAVQNISHTNPDDLDVLLVGPAGQKVLLVSDAGGTADLINVTLTLADGAAASLANSSQLTSGTFKPSNFDTSTDVFPSPAPAAPYSAALSAFNGQIANGTWALYVRDDASSNPGTFAGGWNLTLTTVPPPSLLPTISDIANQATTMNTATPALPFTVGDPDTPVANLAVSGSSSNTALVPNANLSFGGSGANRTLTVVPATGQTGTSTITVDVSDGTSTASDTFVLTVAAVNTPPTISDILNAVINEDAATGALAFTVGDAQTAAGSLTVTGISSNTTLVPNAAILFGGSGANRTVTVTPAANQSGVSTITINVSDGLVSASDSLVLTVNAVNDPPTISDIANQTTSPGTATPALSFTVGDVETAAGSLTVSGTSSNTTLVPNASIVSGGGGANRTVTVTPAPNQSGSATINVSVSDGLVSASDTFVLTVVAPASGELVAAYSFDAGTGTSLADFSGNGNDGTVSGAVWTTSGRNAGALVFDGINDMVTVADASSLDLTTGMTIEAWIYPTVNSGVRDVLIKEGSNVDIYNLYHRNWRGLPEGNAFVGGSNRTAEGTALAINVWTHLGTTYDGAVLRLFVNGSQVASSTVAGSITTSTGALRIGGNSLWPEYFQGRIDDVRIYNRALSAAEIQSDMNSPVGAMAVQARSRPMNPPVTLAEPLLALDGLPSSGGVQLQITVPAGSSVTLETSIDLVDWIPLATFDDPRTPVDFTDEGGAGSPRKFYRLRVTPIDQSISP